MNKLSKHSGILRTRLSQQSSIKKIRGIENQTLQIILDSFLRAKSVSNNQKDNEKFALCEEYRTKLLNDSTEISYEVFSSDKVNTVQKICKIAASPEKWCRFLFYLAQSMDQAKILEIGTNVGVSGTYLLHGAKNNGGYLTTMEGLPQLCELSSNQFATIVPESNFSVIQGLYNQTFPELLKREESYNLIFIDGNHQKEPTLQYFYELQNKTEGAAIFVFDDINWSQGMEEAWDTIKKDSSVNFSIDLYKQGIVIIDPNETRKNIDFSLHLSY